MAPAVISHATPGGEPNTVPHRRCRGHFASHLSRTDSPRSSAWRTRPGAFARRAAGMSGSCAAPVSGKDENANSRFRDRSTPLAGSISAPFNRSGLRTQSDVQASAMPACLLVQNAPASANSGSVLNSKRASVPNRSRGSHRYIRKTGRCDSRMTHEFAKCQTSMPIAEYPMRWFVPDRITGAEYFAATAAHLDATISHLGATVDQNATESGIFSGND